MVNIFQKLLMLLLILFSIACKKEKLLENNNIPEPETIFQNYSQLHTGNYWIYERYNVDTNGNAVSQNIFDSCYVEKDTTINGKLYFKHVKPYISASNTVISFIRDSLHYLVNQHGEILFSSEDFITIFKTSSYLVGNDTMYKMELKMADKDLQVETPAGIFLTSNAQQKYLMYPNWDIYGNPRYMHTRYAKDIGVVIETMPFFVNNPNYTERRLVRYNISDSN